MREEESLGQNGGDGKGHFLISRRQFLKLGAGIIILFSWEDLEAQQRRQALPTDFNAFLHIGEDGRVTCFTGKIEMGQGIITSLAQMLAEELDVPLSSVQMVMGDTDLCPWDAGTFGSRSTPFFGPPLREAAAEAKAILLALAAEHLRLKEEDLKIVDGIIFDKGNPSNRVTYGQLTKGKRIERSLGRKAALKPFSAFTVSGRSAERTDGLNKVTGKAHYAGDIRLADMYYAKILRPPVHGAKLKSVDTSEAEKVEGIKVIRDGDLIAVLHPYPDVAEKALVQIKVQYDLPDSGVDGKTIFGHLLKVAPEGEVLTQGGDLKEGEKLSSDVFEKTYLNQYVAHATIETHTALARLEGDRVTVWASTQSPFRAKDEVAQALGISSQNVRIITPFVGGGFGGKNMNRQVIEAARLAKRTGKPVQVAWSRQEEFFYDTFRPAAVVKIKSGATRTGKIVFWSFDTYFAGPRGVEQIYDIPHHHEASHGHYTGSPGAHPFSTGPWRAPGINTNTFARESHIDIMAAKLGIDPLEFRLKNLKDQRLIKALKTAAERFGWISSRSASGRGIGMACAVDVGARVATMAELDVDQGSGQVRVGRIVCALDIGQVINPEGASMQMEGSLMMGLGYALTEEVHFKGGQILDNNFDTYEIPRFSWLPKIDAILVPNPDVPPLGGGEPPIVCMGGAIANAIFNATGARLLELPMTPERIKTAMAQTRR
jgi:isoquinoline 1-oxidoreductase